MGQQGQNESNRPLNLTTETATEAAPAPKGKQTVVMIPLGGLGSRFKNDGFSLLKPFIRVMGKPIIYWLLENLDLSLDMLGYVCVPYNLELAENHFEERLRKDFPKIPFFFHKLTYQTAGAAETLLVGMKALQDSVKDNAAEVARIDEMPIISIDGDAFFIPDILTQWAGDNASLVWFDQTPDPIYSYCQPPADKDGELVERTSEITGKTQTERKFVDIAEKVRISDYANAGGYGFESVAALKKYCQLILDKDIRQKNEFYTSGVIKQMLNDGYTFWLKQIKLADFVTLGVPNHLKDFALRGTCTEANSVEDGVEKNLVYFPEFTIYDKTRRNVPHGQKIVLCHNLSKDEFESGFAPYMKYLTTLAPVIDKVENVEYTPAKLDELLGKPTDYSFLIFATNNKEKLVEECKMMTSDASTTGRHILSTGTGGVVDKTAKNVFLVTTADELQKELGWYLPCDTGMLLI